MYRICALCCFCIIGFGYGYQPPQLSWKFNDLPRSGYIHEVSSNVSNRGRLLPNTKIINVSDSFESTVICFNGTGSGLIIDNLTSACFNEPWSCKNGLSVTFVVRFQKWNDNGIILSSANVKIASAANKTIVVSIWNGTHEWKLPYKLKSLSWKCLTVSWNTTTLKIYRSRLLVANTSNTSPVKSSYLGDNAVARRLVLGNTAGKEDAKGNWMNMHIDHLSIWNETIAKKDINNACKKGGGVFVSTYNIKFYSQIFTSQEYKDKALFGHVFKSHNNVTGVDECIERCKDKQCKSFNYGKISHLCELNSVEAKDNELLIRKREEFQFYDVYWTEN